MVLCISLGLLKIPIMVVNYANNRYSVSGLHQFSNCCNEPVGNKKYCKGCGKDVLNSDIRKGLDKETILSDEQMDNLKEHLEGGLMEVVAIKNFKAEILFELIPFIQKSQLVLPSISKGFKKTDIKTFYSFASALREGNKFCIVKLVQRAVEHLGILVFHNEDLLFLEVPFKNYNNLPEIKRLKEGVENVISADKITNLETFKEQASGFLKQFKNKENKIELVKEEKLVLLKKYIEDVRNGVVTTPNVVKQEVNPFAV